MSSGLWAATAAGKAAALASIPPQRAVDLQQGIEHAMKAMNLETDLHLTYLVIQGDPLGLESARDADLFRLVFRRVYEDMPEQQKRVAAMLGLTQKEVDAMDIHMRGSKASIGQTMSRARRFLSAKVRLMLFLQARRATCEQSMRLLPSLSLRCPTAKHVGRPASQAVSGMAPLS